MIGGGAALAAAHATRTRDVPDHSKSPGRVRTRTNSDPSASAEMKVVEEFSNLDGDGSGFVTMAEFTRGLVQTGKMTMGEAAEAFAKADTEGDGKINIMEYVSHIAKPKQEEEQKKVQELQAMVKGADYNSMMGRRFVAYHAARGARGEDSAFDEDAVPDVEMAIKVYRVSDVDIRAGSFNCEFTVMLDWVDPSLELEKNPKYKPEDWMEVCV